MSCHANAMSMPCPQCHVIAMCQCHVSMPCLALRSDGSHASRDSEHHPCPMAHTILAVPYLKPNRGWASPCPTCISNTINHTEPCECHVRAMSVPCQCHFSAALSMPWQCNVKCHVNAMSAQCRCCSRNKTCMSENQHQGSMYI